MRIFLSEKAEKELNRLDKQVKERIVKALKKLSGNFIGLNIKKLRSKESIWRLAVGEWRVIFEVQWNDKFILILHIKDRRDVY